MYGRKNPNKMTIWFQKVTLLKDSALSSGAPLRGLDQLDRQFLEIMQLSFPVGGAMQRLSPAT
jgi:hypothetical protein